MAIECGLDRLRAVTVAEQVRILIKNGQLHEAEAAFRAGDLVQDMEPFPTLNPTRQNESVAIAWLRIETHNHRLTRGAQGRQEMERFRAPHRGDPVRRDLRAAAGGDCGAGGRPVRGAAGGARGGGAGRAGRLDADFFWTRGSRSARC